MSAPDVISSGPEATVSILIPCYNAERWIAQAIESALAQTWPATEVIVIDDGSTDHSLEIIKRYAGRVRWETGPNRGGNRARNRLLELATGEWLQYLDADDYLLPGKIAGQMRSSREHGQADIVFGPVILEYAEAGPPRQEILPIPPCEDLWVMLARWHLPQTGASLWRRQALLDVGGWADSQPCCQEHELYLRMLAAGKVFVYSPAAGAVYRQWGEHTVCRRDPRQTRRERLKIERRIEEHLSSRQELTVERLRAINQARFELARVAWHHDRDEALQIIESVRHSYPDFVPDGKAAPWAYRSLYRWLGFTLTESIADIRRRVVQ